MRYIALLLLLASVIVAQQSRWSSDITFGGAVEYDDSYWDDSQVPALAITGGASAPGLIAFNGSSVLKVYGFDGAGTADDGEFSIQMSHRVKTGGQLIPHVHWCRTADPSNAAYTNVVWQLTYSMADVNGVFHSEAVLLATNAIAAANWTHQITSFGAITNTGALSQVMVGNISRLSNNASDTYDKDAGFLGLDIHFEIDSPGTRDEYQK